MRFPLVCEDATDASVRRAEVFGRARLPPSRGDVTPARREPRPPGRLALPVVLGIVAGEKGLPAPAGCDMDECVSPNLPPSAPGAIMPANDFPLIFDAHLDLAWNALDWNRDLRLSVADIRKREKEQQMTGKGR